VAERCGGEEKGEGDAAEGLVQGDLRGWFSVVSVAGELYVKNLCCR
jgi:hypothetical protein